MDLITLGSNTRARLSNVSRNITTVRSAGNTFYRRPVTLLFHQEFERITDAIAVERQLKGWSRAKKEALIAGDVETLHELARGPITLHK